MVNWINKIIIICFYFSILISDDIYISKIEVEGLVTATKNQIFRNIGLYPSEVFSDKNDNGIFDDSENYIDENYNNKFDFGSSISNNENQIDFERFSLAIKSLLRLKVFSDVQIFVTSYNENFIDIKIVVEELPVLKSIEFEGCKKIKESTLIDKINLLTMQRLSENDILKAKNIIIQEYESKNYHNIKVNHKFTETNDKYSKNILFKISEGNKLKIKKIIFKGNDSFSKSKLLKNFNSISEHKWYKFWKGNFNKNEFNNDMKNLETFYKDNGYRDMQVINKEVNINSDEIIINILISENQINYFKNFSFQGNKIFKDSELLEYLALKNNQIYSKTEFDLAVGSLKSKYLDEGYFFVQLDYEIIPDLENNLDVNFFVTENQKTKIRKISISGNNKTYENVIRREMKIYPGDIFSYNKIYDSLNSIFLLNYFENVVPDISTISDSDNQVDIKLSVVEKETGRANFSMGYNEVQGLTGGGGFEFINFMGKGQMLSINYSKGLQNQIQNQSITSNSSTYNDYESFSFSFREPWLFDTPNSIGFSISHSEQGKSSSSLLKYDTISDRVSIMFGRRFEWPDYFFKGNWSLSIRKTDYRGPISELINDFDESIIVEESSTLGYASRRGVSISQVISRDSRNRPEFPTEGSKFLWSSTFSGSLLGGNESYHKQVFSFDWYSPVYNEIVMFQNFKFGALLELDDNQFIPYSARFVMGGTGIPYGEMLRGYVDNGIGPKKISSGYLSSDGGKIMVKYSMELRYKFSDSPTIYGLIFGDAGNVWENFESVDIFNLKRAVGVGIRIHMPMLGMLGYDVGYGFDSIYNDSNTPSGWEHHLLFGMPMN